MPQRIIFHIDFNSYFATVEQQANPRLRGKPVGVTGGDRMVRTVLGAASIEAKLRGVKGGMSIPEARSICPEIILVQGDSDKYLATTQKFLNILKDYCPTLEIFSIDECFLELAECSFDQSIEIAQEIKSRISLEVGEWISCSIGISYNKFLAKLAGSLYKKDGLVIIADEVAAQWLLDRVELDQVCGIGSRIKRRLLNMGVVSFKSLRLLSRQSLIREFKSYGEHLFNLSRGEDHTPIIPFYERKEVKSIGHRHTLDYDTSDSQQIRQLLLKLTEMLARRLRAKALRAKTLHFGFRTREFKGEYIQTSFLPTSDGIDLFKAAWSIFKKLWLGQSLRMIAVTVSNLEKLYPSTLSFLDDSVREQKIIKVLDLINNRYGEFTLERAVLLGSVEMRRKPNPYLSDRRFKI